MKRYSRQYLFGFSVFGISCILALWVWMPKNLDTAQEQARPTYDLSESVTEMQKRMSDLVVVTGTRPLFNVSRRPAPTSQPRPDAPISAPPPEQVTLNLVGVLGDQGNYVALVRLSDSPQLYRLEVGQQIGQFQIMAIEDASIQVSNDDGETEQIVIGE